MWGGVELCIDLDISIGIGRGVRVGIHVCIYPHCMHILTNLSVVVFEVLLHSLCVKLEKSQENNLVCALRCLQHFSAFHFVCVL